MSIIRKRTGRKLHLSVDNSVCPSSVYEDGGCFTVFIAGDGKIVRTNHKIDVDHTVVYAELTAFLKCAVLKVFDAVHEAASECNVTAGVFIKEGVVEEDTAFGNRAILQQSRC